MLVLQKPLRIIVSMLVVFALNPSHVVHATTENTKSSVVSPVIDPQSGLVEASGKNMVVAHCSACHSTTLITQNTMSRERWLDTIRWMQKTQQLWPLGDAEPLILDYLSTWYGPKTVSRRQPLAPHLLPKSAN